MIPDPQHQPQEREKWCNCYVPGRDLPCPVHDLVYGETLPTPWVDPREQVAALSAEIAHLREEQFDANRAIADKDAELRRAYAIASVY